MLTLGWEKERKNTKKQETRKLLSMLTKTKCNVKYNNFCCIYSILNVNTVLEIDRRALSIDIIFLSKNCLTQKNAFCFLAELRVGFSQSWVLNMLVCMRKNANGG